ncbi:hypothetical protein LJC38_03710 [Parabacteroides sp. OttesenSCG-928-K15]|nr:hypothetical protein [Parabacteroides sp. OttesenSCG-928-K15]
MLRKIYDRFFLCLLLFLLPTTLIRPQEIPSDSIWFYLDGLPGQEKLHYLEETTKNNVYHTNYRSYIERYKEEALRQGDNNHLSYALEMLAKSYYPVAIDSMILHMEKLAEVAQKTNNYDGYLDVYSLYIYSLIWQGKNAEVYQGVKKLKEFSREIKSETGLELANLTLAYFHIINRHFEEAETIYLEVLKNKEKKNAPYVEQIGILVQLFQYMDSEEKKIYYLGKTKERIDAYKASLGEGEKMNRQIVAFVFSAHSVYAAILLKQKKYEEALVQIRELEKLAFNNQLDEDKIASIHSIYFSYYNCLGNYPKALQHLELTEENARKRAYVHELIELLARKVDIYIYQQQFEKAIDVQKEIIHISDSVFQSEYRSAMAEIRAEYEVERLEMEKEQMLLRSEKTRNQMILLVCGCCILLFVVIGLIHLNRVSARRKKILKHAKEKAEEADRMKSTFLANMNHEIRTPLNAIVGFSQILVEEEDKESRKEFTEIILHNNELLQQLITDILDISKIESNSISLFYGIVDMPSLMKELYHIFKLRIPDKLQLILDPCDSLQMSTDRNRMSQVLGNLLTNAIKHTPQGHIRFGYQLIEGEKILFYVEDTGEGIPENQLEAIFDRFVQLENGRRGVGLGLAISQGLVAKMGGNIWATSQLGKGSTFFIQLNIHTQIE